MHAARSPRLAAFAFVVHLGFSYGSYEARAATNGHWDSLASVGTGGVPVPLVVNASGGGDFTSIRAGYDSLVAAIDCGGTDTLIVRAGFYPETLFAQPATAYCEGVQRVRRIVCPDGPSVTIVKDLRRMCFDEANISDLVVTGFGSIRVEIVGLGFAGPVCLSSTGIRFDSCAFYSQFRLAFGGLASTNLHGCTFHGDVELDPWQWSPLINCRFVQSRVTARNNDGWLKFIGCTFDGPIDTAVIVRPVTSDAIWFEGCTFRDCDVGIAARKPSSDGVRIIGTRFERVRRVGVLEDYTLPDWYEGPRHLRLDVIDSEFIDCGTAVRWGFPYGSSALLDSVEVARSTSTPIELYGGGTVRNSSVVDAAGDGIYLQGGGGVLNSVVRGASGSGISVELTGGAEEVRIQQNTIAGNGGHGVWARHTEPGHSIGLVVERNVVALNGGDGIRSESPYEGRIALNDAWLNYGAPFSGGGEQDSNLTVDPIFCDFVLGDLTVSSASPCRPEAPYGQIGALGVGCTRLADVEGAPEGVQIAVYPNPAKHRVSFRAPWADGPSRAEVLDLQGRVVWRTEIPAGAPVWWDGVTATGVHARPGLYVVRMTLGIRSETRRLVWLE